MRALSLTQPWATAVAIGIKQWETRSWPTGFRGQVAIHAAKGFPGWAKEFAMLEQEEGRLPEGALPLGAIVAIADLVECKPTHAVAPIIGEVETMYGDYAEGRYAFRLENVVPLSKPILARGALGFWEVPVDVELNIREQLKAAPAPSPAETVTAGQGPVTS